MRDVCVHLSESIPSLFGTLLDELGVLNPSSSLHWGSENLIIGIVVTKHGPIYEHNKKIVLQIFIFYSGQLNPWRIELSKDF